MYGVNVNHDSCHRINLSTRGNAYLLNETHRKVKWFNLTTNGLVPTEMV